MAAGITEDHILYDVFIRAEWSLGGEILVRFCLCKLDRYLEFAFRNCNDSFVSLSLL